MVEGGETARASRWNQKFNRDRIHGSGFQARQSSATVRPSRDVFGFEDDTPQSVWIL